MQLDIVVKPFTNVLRAYLNYIMLMIRCVILCPHSRYPRVV